MEKPKKQPEDKEMKNKFLLISLEEKKAKRIAEAINNESARKILDYLAKKDATETDISKELGIPMSTVHYNLKQLEEANLVTVEEFHYSQKGKEINHYSLANKFIIIAPKSEGSKFMEALKRVLPLAIITASVAFIMQLFSTLSSAGPLQASRAAGTVASDAAPKVMGIAAEASRPALQSSGAAMFLIGAVAIIVIYFIYEWAKK